MELTPGTTRGPQETTATGNEAGRTLNAILIDDESKALAVLRRAIERHCPSVRIVAEADDISSGIKAINTAHPQLIFLDVDLTGATGFDLLERIEDRSFHVILVTAHPEFAVRAFRYSVVDYLLKPVEVAELQQAVRKVEELLAGDADRSTKKSDASLASKQTLRIPSAEGAVFVRMEDIVHLEAEGAYTRIHLVDKRYFSSYNLKQFEEHLDPAIFMRVHRSHVVNLKQVKRAQEGNGLVLEMTNGTEVPVARSHKADLLKALR